MRLLLVAILAAAPLLACDDASPVQSLGPDLAADVASVSDSAAPGADAASSDAASSDAASPDGDAASPPVACPIFPADNPWNTDISKLPVHPRSADWVDSIGRQATLHPDFGTVWNGAPNGIPFVRVPADQARVPVSFTWPEESDPGPYPIPPDAPIEGGPDGGGDRHVLMLDEADCRLYELYNAWPQDGGASWTADSGAIFDLRSNALRPDGWTSADAAGLPILPGLVRYEEVAAGEIAHALRFTVEVSQRAYIKPATHAASQDKSEERPPMGARFRLKAGYDCGGLSAEVQVICAALKRYGMLVADNGGDWFVSGAPDPRWDDDALRDLKQLPGDAFEAVDTGPTIPY